MTIHVNVGEAKAKLSELLAKVEEGEDVVISRGNDVIARLVRETVRRSPQEAAASLIRSREKLRAQGVRVSQDEIREWIDEGRRY